MEAILGTFSILFPGWHSLWYHLIHRPLQGFKDPRTSLERGEWKWRRVGGLVGLHHVTPANRDMASLWGIELVTSPRCPLHWWFTMEIGVILSGFYPWGDVALVGPRCACMRVRNATHRWRSPWWRLDLMQLVLNTHSRLTWQHGRVGSPRNPGGSSSAVSNGSAKEIPGILFPRWGDTEGLACLISIIHGMYIFDPCEPLTGECISMILPWKDW